MTDLEYNEPLEAKVVRLYITKDFNLGMFTNLKICSSEKASEILNRYGLMRHLSDFRLDGKYEKPWQRLT